jgi:hypothetical protein
MMTNPGALLLAGNPRSARRKRRAKHTTKPNASEKPMAATRRRRRKNRAHRVAKHKARRAKRRSHRKGKMPAGLKAYWAEKRGKNPKRHRRAGRKSRMKAKRHRRRRAKASNPGGMMLFAAPKRHRRRHHRKHRAHKRRARKARNPGVKAFAMKLLGGFTHLKENLHDTFVRGGVKGALAAVGGAAGAVTAGAIVARGTTPLLGMVAPNLLRNTVVQRVLGAANYYLAGWALAKYTPGLSPRVRRGMLTGATVAAIVEGLKPGMVHEQFAKLPVVGKFFSHTLPGLSDQVGDYVTFALNGVGNIGHNTSSDRWGVPSSTEEGTEDGMPDGVNDYVVGVPNGMGDYVTFR